MVIIRVPAPAVLKVLLISSRLALGSKSFVCITGVIINRFDLKSVFLIDCFDDFDDFISVQGVELKLELSCFITAAYVDGCFDCF